MRHSVHVVGGLFAAVALLVTASAITATTDAEQAHAALHIVRDMCAGSVFRDDGALIVTWDTTVDTDINHLMLGPDASYGTVITANEGTTHVAHIPGVTAGSTIHYRAQSQRSDSNETVLSGDCMAVAPGFDVSAPVVSTVAVRARTSTSAQLAFLTNEPAHAMITVLESGTTPASGSAIVAPADFRTRHHIALHGLTPGTRYTVRFDVVDAAGNSTVTETTLMTEHVE